MKFYSLCDGPFMVHILCSVSYFAILLWRIDAFIVLSCLDKPDIDTLARFMFKKAEENPSGKIGRFFNQMVRTNADKQSKAKYLFSIYWSISEEEVYENIAGYILERGIP